MPDLMEVQTATASNSAGVRGSGVLTKAEVIDGWALAIAAEVVLVPVDGSFRVELRTAPLDAINGILAKIQRELEDLTELPDPAGKPVCMVADSPRLNRRQIGALATLLADRSNNQIVLKPAVYEDAVRPD